MERLVSLVGFMDAVGVPFGAGTYRLEPLVEFLPTTLTCPTSPPELPRVLGNPDSRERLPTLWAHHIRKIDSPPAALQDFGATQKED